MRGVAFFFCATFGVQGIAWEGWIIKLLCTVVSRRCFLHSVSKEGRFLRQQFEPCAAWVEEESLAKEMSHKGSGKYGTQSVHQKSGGCGGLVSMYCCWHEVGVFLWLSGQEIDEHIVLMGNGLTEEAHTAGFCSCVGFGISCEHG